MQPTIKSCAIFLALAMMLVQSTAEVRAQEADQVVILRTTRGDIAIRVFSSMVPLTAGNFLDLVNRHFYDGSVFHRVENGVIQGGDPTGSGTGKFVDPETGDSRHIRLETDRRLRHNQAGVVAMARGPNRNSASCQFYITKMPAPQWDGEYAVFGTVLKGMGTVHGIRRGDRIISARVYGAKGGSAPRSAARSGGTGGQGESGGWTPSHDSYEGPAPQRTEPLPPTGDSGF